MSSIGRFAYLSKSVLIRTNWPAAYHVSQSLHLNPNHFRNPPRYLSIFQNDLRQQESHHENLEQYFDRLKSILNPSGEISTQRPSENRYVEYENLQAYNIMKSMPEYEQTIGQLITSSASRKSILPENSAEFLFLPLGKYDQPHPKVVDLIERVVPSLDGIGIIALQKELLRLLPYCENKSDWYEIFLKSNFTKLWMKLDIVCCNLLQELPDSSLDELITISSLWYELGLHPNNEFQGKLIRKLLYSPRIENDKVSLLHLMFLLNLKRMIGDNQMVSLVKNVRNYLHNYLDSIKFEELSIIALAFHKTNSRMPMPLLGEFISLSTSLLKDHNQIASIYSVSSLLKMIRFSQASTDFDEKRLRIEVSNLIEAIIANPNRSLIDSALCSTRIIELLNSSFLHNNKRMYKTIFDRMIINLGNYRIKDIERIFSCLANAIFLCPNGKLKIVEDYILQSDELHHYPMHVYKIVYYMLVLNFFPWKLIRQCADQEYLNKTYESTGYDLINPALTADAILRIETDNSRLLHNERQVLEYHEQLVQGISMEGANHEDSKKGRFMTNICSVLKRQCPDQFRLLQIFPFSWYPVPVLLNEKLAKIIRPPSGEGNLFEQSHPFQLNQLYAGSFENSTALLLLTIKDQIAGHIDSERIRGFAALTKRLLQKLGFRVVLLHQHNFHYWVRPRHAQSQQAQEYKQCERDLLDAIFRK